MKLPTAISYTLASLLLGASLLALADAKDAVIDKQQQMTQEEMDAAKNATPTNEQRPAANTTQSKHSTESPKGDMIKKNKKAVDKAIDDTEAAKPKDERRPATGY